MNCFNRVSLVSFLVLCMTGCGDDDGGQNGTCRLSLTDVAEGDPGGHPDPFGARAAGQARAGRIASADQIVTGPDQRNPVRVGDFVLANDRIAVYLEDLGLSDGYASFGAEILAVDEVGEDGRPLGRSVYNEALLGLGIEMLKPESLTVLNDGADGQAAVIRVKGRFERIAFLADILESFFSDPIERPGYYDYVLEPGSSTLTVRLGLINDRDQPLDVSGFELYGFFHFNRAELFVPSKGFEKGAGTDVAYFDGHPFGFAVKPREGRLSFMIEASGFQLFLGTGLTMDPCTTYEGDRFDIIGGGPHLDGLMATVRVELGQAEQRTLSGVLRDHAGAPVAEAKVQVTDGDGLYLGRTITAADGSFTVHAPDGTVTLQAEKRGYRTTAPVTAPSGSATVDLAFAPTGTLAVEVSDASTLEPLPGFAQVFPMDPAAPPPVAWGTPDVYDPKVHDLFIHGAATEVPTFVGEHRVIVTRGFHHEVHDATVIIEAGETALVDAPLVRSVDPSGYLCGDFHAHTRNSADSRDPVPLKVAAAVALGLDLPLTSDHEWVTNPQPTVEALGLADQYVGFTSLELTTFRWGHFGILTLTARPEAANNGAFVWVDREPADVFAEVHARPEQPLIMVNHPRAATVQGYFREAAFDPETATGNDLYSADYDLLEACNGDSFEANRDASIADWFGLLESGRQIIGIGNSDNHFVRNGGYGYPRTCLYLGDDPAAVTPASLRAALVSGDVFVSGGIHVVVTGPGNERMGQTIPATGADVELTAVIQAPSWVPVDSLEVIVNGETLETIPLVGGGPGPGKRIVVPVTVPVDGTRRSWVVLHATGAGDLAPLYPGRESFGYTNPIYVE
jgi:hypothetical protein